MRISNEVKTHWVRWDVFYVGTYIVDMVLFTRCTQELVPLQAARSRGTSRSRQNKYTWREEDVIRFVIKKNVIKKKQPLCLSSVANCRPRISTRQSDKKASSYQQKCKLESGRFEFLKVFKDSFGGYFLPRVQILWILMQRNPSDESRFVTQWLTGGNSFLMQMDRSKRERKLSAHASPPFFRSQLRKAALRTGSVRFRQRSRLINPAKLV